MFTRINGRLPCNAVQLVADASGVEGQLWHYFLTGSGAAAGVAKGT